MKKQTRYSPEVRERAVRLVHELVIQDRSLTTSWPLAQYR